MRDVIAGLSARPYCAALSGSAPSAAIKSAMIGYALATLGFDDLTLEYPDNSLPEISLPEIPPPEIWVS